MRVALLLAALAMTATSAQATDARYLALGDSYTIGEGVADSERWPAQLVAALQADHAVAAPEIVARTGWTTDELAAAMRGQRFQPPYALVTLLIGVNNQYRGRSLDTYRDEFRALLTRAIELAGGHANRVVVVTIPDWGVTPFAQASGRDVAQIGRELDAYNAANDAITRELGARHVDIAAIARDGGGTPAMLVGDGLHPSGAMYARWVQAILPAARAALAGP